LVIIKRNSPWVSPVMTSSLSATIILYLIAHYSFLTQQQTAPVTSTLCVFCLYIYLPECICNSNDTF